MGPLEITVLLCGGLLGTFLGAIVDRYRAKRRLFKPLKTPSRPLSTSSNLSVKRLLEIDRRGAEIVERLQAIQGLRDEVERYLSPRDQQKMLKMLDALEKALQKEINQYRRTFNFHYHNSPY